MKIKRLILFVLAGAIFAFYQFGMIRWMASGHGLIDSWKELMAMDWLLKIIFFDGGLFAIMCLSWMTIDFQKARISRASMIIYFLLTIVFGAAGFLVYLALRKKKD